MNPSQARAGLPPGRLSAAGASPHHLSVPTSQDKRSDPLQSRSGRQLSLRPTRLSLLSQYGQLRSRIAGPLPRAHLPLRPPLLPPLQEEAT